MLKLIGSLCILGGGFLLRRISLAQRRRQRDTLSELACALRRMSEEIRSTRKPLPLLLKQLTDHCETEAAALFAAAAEAAAAKGSVERVWREAAETLPLSRETGHTLAELGADLRGDAEQICNAISLVMLHLSVDAEEWDKNFRTDGQRISALCLSGAALLVILLI